VHHSSRQPLPVATVATILGGGDGLERLAKALRGHLSAARRSVQPRLYQVTGGLEELNGALTIIPELDYELREQLGLRMVDHDASLSRGPMTWRRGHATPLPHAPERRAST
jgi:hypothetical protein